VIVDPSVRLLREGRVAYTSNPVQVWRENAGAVHIDPPRTDMGLLNQRPFDNPRDDAVERNNP